MAKDVGVSFKPEDFAEGGGLLDNVDVTFKEVRFVMFDYNGKSPEASPALKALLATADGQMEQYWSAGQAKDWTPSKDGTKLVSVGSAKQLSKSSNFFIFIKSLIDSGFPADKISDDCSVFDGLQAHVVRIPAPKRDGLAKSGDKKYEDKILTVDQIIKLPWEADKGGGSTGGGDDDLESDVMGKVMELLPGYGAKGVKIDKLATDVFNALGKEYKSRSAATKLVLSADFHDGKPWEFDAGTKIIKAAD